MTQSQSSAWENFTKSGTVESYLKYAATKNLSGEVKYADDLKRSGNKGEQLR